MSEKLCCANCFGDPGLERNIIPKVVSDGSGDPVVGSCDYCLTEGTLLVVPADLGQWFETVVDCYIPNTNGKPLVTHLRADWSLFGHPVMDDAHAKELLADILNDGEIVRKLFSPIELLVSESPQKWNDLRDEMMHRNRWFLDEPIDLDRLSELLENLNSTHEEIAGTWYRARLSPGRIPFSLNEMGAPPTHLAGHGRANPAGIRYLYLGSEPRTAVAEVRPHTGEIACLATFAVPSIRVVDLRNPRKHVSPFILDSAEQIARVRGGLPLLERLGYELTKPVQPQSAPFEYIPSQYLCEFIKKCGYEGVVYRSSVSDGINLALFDPDIAQALEVSVSHVDRVSVDISPVAELSPTVEL